MQYWVAVEDASTRVIGEFGEVDERDVQYLMAGYRVDLCRPAQVRVRDTEEGNNIVYDGAVYKGQSGYNLWVMHKHTEM